MNVPRLWNRKKKSVRRTKKGSRFGARNRRWLTLHLVPVTRWFSRRIDPIIRKEVMISICTSIQSKKPSKRWTAAFLLFKLKTIRPTPCPVVRKQCQSRDLMGSIAPMKTSFLPTDLAMSMEVLLLTVRTRFVRTQLVHLTQRPRMALKRRLITRWKRMTSNTEPQVATLIVPDTLPLVSISILEESNPSASHVVRYDRSYLC